MTPDTRSMNAVLSQQIDLPFDSSRNMGLHGLVSVTCFPEEVPPDRYSKRRESSKRFMEIRRRGSSQQQKSGSPNQSHSSFYPSICSQSSSSSLSSSSSSSSSLRLVPPAPPPSRIPLIDFRLMTLSPSGVTDASQRANLSALKYYLILLNILNRKVEPESEARICGIRSHKEVVFKVVNSINSAQVACKNKGEKRADEKRVSYSWAGREWAPAPRSRSRQL